MLLNIVVSIILLRIPTFYMLTMIFQNIEEIMDAKLKRLVNWRAATKLSLNESKTQLFFFCSERQHHHTVSNIKRNNFVVEPIKSVISGISETEETLSWNKQIENASKNFSSTNRTVSKLRLSMFLSKH